MAHVADDPHMHKGTVVGNGHCARHVQTVVPAVGHSSTWRRGEKVRDAHNVPCGTVIATFNSAGRYANATDGSSHIAILIERQPDGLVVNDQWIGKPVSERVIRYKGGAGKPVDDGDQYWIVET